MKPLFVCVVVVAIACSSRQPTERDTAQTVDCVVPGPGMSPPSATLHVGDTLRAKVTWIPCPSDAHIADPTSAIAYRWSSSDTSVVTVDSLALVRARKQGTATVIAKSRADLNVSAAMVAVVTP